jgi:lipid A 3-O-deacylase
MKRLLPAALLLVLIASPASAQEVFGGVLAHDVKTGLTKSGFEGGVDFQLGWRGERLGFLKDFGRPSPHAFVSVNSDGGTHFAAAGISWKIGDRVFLRPGVGLAIHDRSSNAVVGNRRMDFGSRILFAPELGLGVAVNDRVSIEASWVHLSHAQLFSAQNPGLDTIGVRLSYRFR